MSSPHVSRRHTSQMPCLALWLFLFVLICRTAPPAIAAAIPQVALPQDVPTAVLLKAARPMGRVSAAAPIQLSIALPLRNQTQLTSLLHSLYTPGDPLYHKFLKPADFASRFGPTQADYAAVSSWAAAQGLTITKTYTSHTLLNLSAPSARVEAAFGVHLNSYLTPEGRVAHANDVAPKVPLSIAGKISGVIGLDNLVTWHSHSHVMSHRYPMSALWNPHATGTPIIGRFGNGLTPEDIRDAYNLRLQNQGEGQTIALAELDGYTLSDILTYAQFYNLPTPTIQNVLENGFSGIPGSAEGEVTLDIEMVLALAPKANILVYELANGTTNALATLFTDIAADDKAPCTSLSFGEPELAVSQTERDAENTALQQLAAQGQAVFVAAGDNGAYDNAGPPTNTNPPTLSVDDPGSQPYSTDVGGTKITVNGYTGAFPAAYISETSWNSAAGQTVDTGGGGGISAVWPKPSYQAGEGASPTMRDVPDVSLNADPDTGYSVYDTNEGGFTVIGGTSAAAPLWAAFMTLVNQQRATNGLAPVGFANPSIYAVAENPVTYARDFHDIADGSTNLYYPALPGYDDSTGWGSFNGVNLLNDLSQTTSITAPGSPGTLSGVVIFSDGNPNNVTATVTAVSPTGGTVKTTTDTSGNYTLSLPSGATFTVSVDAPGYAGQSVSGITIATAGGTLTQNFTVIAEGAVSGQAHVFSTPGEQMISSPYAYDAATADFATLFGLTLPLGAGSPLLTAFNPSANNGSGAYVFYPTYPADTLHLGVGYWLRIPAGGTYIHRQGTATTANPFTITLQKGWNMIGDPYTGSVPISTITVSAGSGTPATLGTTAANNLIILPLYQFASLTPPYYTSLNAGSTIDPWLGYWIYATQAVTLSIPAP